MANKAYSGKSHVAERFKEFEKARTGGYRGEAAYLANWLSQLDGQNYSSGDLEKIARVVRRFLKNTETPTIMSKEDRFPKQINYIREKIEKLVPKAYSRDVKEDTKSMDFPKARRYFLENLREAKKGGDVADLEALAKNIHPILSKSMSRSALGGVDLEQQRSRLEKLTLKTLGNAYLKEARKDSNNEAALKDLKRAAELFGKIGYDNGVDKVNKMSIRLSSKIPKIQEAVKLEGLGEYGSAAALYRKVVFDKTMPDPVKEFAREEITRLQSKIRGPKKV